MHNLHCFTFKRTALFIWIVMQIYGYESEVRYKLQSIKPFLKLSEGELKSLSKWLRKVLSTIHEERKNTFSKTENLNEFISPFVSDINCLAVINNFENVDISPMVTPVVLRSFEILLYPGEFLSFISYQVLIWSPRNFQTTNESAEGCPFSKYLLDVRTLPSANEDFCFRVNLTEYVKHIKPWGCQVQFHLFPSTAALNSRVPGNLVWKYIKESGKTLNFPSPHRVIHIFVHNQKLFSKKSRNGWIREVTLSTQDTTKPELKSIIILIFVENIKTAHFLEEIKSQISGESHVVRFCPGCLLQISQQVGIVSTVLLKSHKSLLSFRFLYSLVFPSSEEGYLWELAYSEAHVNLLDLTTRVLGSCNGSFDAYFKNISRYTEFRTAVTNRNLSHAYANLISAIMGNYTIVDIHYELFCKNGISENWAKKSLRINRLYLTEFGQAPYLQDHFYFPYFPQDQSNNLRFLSCGQRGLSQLPFNELTGIFDSWIWLTICSSATALVFFTMSYSKTEPYKPFGLQ